LENEEMKKILIFLVAAGMVFGIALSLFGADGKKLLIIDVRTEAEWNNGHIEGAILIPYESIGEKIESVTKDKAMRIYVYCRTGRRSQIAKESLAKLGYQNVINLGSLEDAAKTMKLRIVK
jgi:phage shock protein E